MRERYDQLYTPVVSKDRQDQKKTQSILYRKVGQKMKDSQNVNFSGMSPTMSLVIGIIIGSFTAMILIVIIVLKVIFA